MNSKTMKTIVLVLMIVLVTITVISSATPVTNQVPKRQQFETCTCLQEIDNANAYTESLHQQQTAKHDALLKRVIDLENEFYSSINTINSILSRVTNLENYLLGNVTFLNQKIQDEANAVFNTVNSELIVVSGYLNNKINKLNGEVANLKNQIINNPYPTPAPSDPGLALEVYYNITRRIDNLEYVKMANLTVDNHIWRKNFRVVNATFERIKSTCTNNCLCSTCNL